MPADEEEPQVHEETRKERIAARKQREREREQREQMRAAKRGNGREEVDEEDGDEEEVLTIDELQNELAELEALLSKGGLGDRWKNI